MSDSQDQAMERLANHLARTYVALATLCLNLPLPITLPTGMISQDDVVPAIRRVMDICEDIPMPEDQQATLFAGCAFWLGAMDLYELLADDFNMARAHSAAACILMADDNLTDMALWLRDQQRQQD
ncbi:hypothetical protein [Streptomyces thermolilacinus]|uniref:hypothetical protein n=1 Tax=Streptomyces thermolilacinus TaxID=285540 RepID=UPI00340DBE52